MTWSGQYFKRNKLKKKEWKDGYSSFLGKNVVDEN